MYECYSESESEEEICQWHKSLARHRRVHNSYTDSEPSIGRHETSRRHFYKYFRAPHCNNDCFRKSLHWRIYLLADRSSSYDDGVSSNVANWDKYIQIQMKSKFLDTSDAIQFLLFYNPLVRLVIRMAKMNKPLSACWNFSWIPAITGINACITLKYM